MLKRTAAVFAAAASAGQAADSAGGPDSAEQAADDVVDAAIVAWSARRIARGEARPLPDPPEVAHGRPVAIWR